VGEEQEVVSKVRRRARNGAVRRGLSVIVALAALAFIGGFGRGMWVEVGRSPQSYHRVETASRFPFLTKLSIHSANAIADRQLATDERTELAGRNPFQESSSEYSRWHDREFQARGGAGTSFESRTRSGDSDRRDGGTRARAGDDGRTRDPIRMPDPVVDPDPGDEPEPPTFVDPPKPDTRPKPEDPPLRVTKPLPGPRIESWEARVDLKTRELIKKAHKAYETACKTYEGALPSAPASGRDRAARRAFKQMKVARHLYEVALRRRIPSDLEKDFEQRIWHLQRMMYKCQKFTAFR
jgi:hypothetical protein